MMKLSSRRSHYMMQGKYFCFCFLFLCFCVFFSAGKLKCIVDAAENWEIRPNFIRTEQVRKWEIRLRKWVLLNEFNFDCFSDYMHRIWYVKVYYSCKISSSKSDLWGTFQLFALIIQMQMHAAFSGQLIRRYFAPEQIKIVICIK